jgi:hypothetical protein
MKTLDLRKTVYLAIGILVAAMILVTTSVFGMNL